MSIENEEPVTYTDTHMWAELAAKKIKTVCFSFEGSGDSGEINFEEVTYKNETKNKELSKQAISNLENLMCDALEEEYGGWEINDGSYGNLVFNVDTLVVEIAITQRVMSEQDYNSEVQLVKQKIEEDSNLFEENS
jgi:hypothetical protein